MKTIKAVIIALIAIVAFQSCTRIDAANEGILVDQYGSNKGNGVSLVSGTVWYNPITKDVYEYPVHIRTKDYDPFTVNAKDGSIFTVDPTISYQIIRGKSPDIFKKYRLSIGELEDGVLRNFVKDAFRNVFNAYTTDNILSQRQQFDNQVTDLLKAELNKEGFSVEQLTLGIEYPKSITDAINAKNQAVQDAERERNKLVQDSIEARRKVIVAEGEAEANKLKQQTLTPLLIQQQFIEKWDGKTALYGTNPVTFKNIQ